MPSDKRSGGDGRKPPRGPRKPSGSEPASGGFRKVRADGDAPPRRPRAAFGEERAARPRPSFRGGDEGAERPFKPRAPFRERAAEDGAPRRSFRDRDAGGGERPSKPRPSFRDRDEGGGRPFKPRPSFRDRDEGGERPSKPRPSFRDRDEGGERPFKPRPSFRDRDEGGERPFKPRPSFRDRDEGGERPFKPRPSFRDRDEGGERPFKPRPSFRDRDEGGDRPRPFRARPADRDGDRRPRVERIERDGEGPRRPFRSFHREDGTGERSFDEHRDPRGRVRDAGGSRSHESGRPFRSRFEVGDDDLPPRRAFEPRFEERRERRPERPGRRDERPAAGKAPRRKPAAEAAAPAESGFAGDRIAKVVARAGLGSRRDVEVWIEEGRVAVNGEVLTSAARNVTADDRVTIDGKPLPRRERTRLWLYHKPRGLVTTEKDPEGRPTVFEHLPAGLPRVMSVGRLDINTEGLLLLTNDGGLARLLELPKTGWMRRYRVRAHGETDQSVLDGLFAGVTVDGVEYGPVEARLDKEQGSNSWLTLGLREGKNREVRNVLASIGLDVNRLIRVSYGPFQLGELAEGAVEEVGTRVLQDQLGTELIAEAECEFDAPVFERPLDEQAPAPGKKEKRRGLRLEGGEGEAARVMRGGLIEDRRGRRVLVQRVSDEVQEAPARRPRSSRSDAGRHGPADDAGDARPFKPRPSFRDRDEGEERPRRSFRDRDAGEARPFKPRPSARDRDEGEERPRRSFRDRDAGDARPFKPRPAARDRDEGEERPRRSFRDRDAGDARPFKPRPAARDEGEERPRRTFRDRDAGDARPFKPRPSFRDRDEGGERPSRPRRFEDRDAGERPFKPRASFRDRDGGGPGKPGGGKGPPKGRPTGRRPRDV